MNICPKCGLPLEACVCEQIGKESQRIRVTTDKKRYGKIVTIVSGFDKDVEIKKIAKDLKNKLACGGTFEGSSVVLQGDHTRQIKPVLEGMGFNIE